MERILVISDIHGELDALNKLLCKAKYQADKDQLILLGDYVDRGPDSKGVINKVIELKSQGAIVLRGNHDEMMIAAAENEPNAWKRWEKNGAIHTLKSYDSSIENMEVPHTHIFKEHIDFLKELDYFYETDQYIFVHAGVDPTIPVHKTDPYRLVWIREEFYHSYQGKKTVVFGHSRTIRFNGKGENSVYFGSNNIIGIDGSAAYGGQLNCLELPSNSVYYIKT